MNKKLISFLAATAMIVTFSHESMALVSEVVNDGNVVIEQEKDPSDATAENEVSDSQDAPEANTAEDTQVSATNAVEVSDWNGLKTEIENANGEKNIILNGKFDKGYSDTAINIKNGQNIKLISKDEKTISITRNSDDSNNGEFVVDDGGTLIINSDLDINPKSENGTLTNANFIKVEKGGNLIVNKEITAHTNENKGGDFGLILCEGHMTINDGAKISGYTVDESDRGAELAAIVVKGTGALTMNGGEVSGNYNKAYNYAEGAAIQVKNGAQFIMKENSIITNNGKFNDYRGQLSTDNCIYGSGVYVYGAESKFIMEGGKISDNFGYKGVGIYTEGENNEKKAILKINKGDISENKLYNEGRQSNFGGGIYAEYAEVSINGKKDEKININNNGVDKEKILEGGTHYQSYGGGIYTKNSNVSIINTVISENKTSGNNRQGGGGACFEDSNEKYEDIIKNKITISSSEIKDNQAGHNTNQYGGGVYVLGNSDVTIKDNTIISGNISSPKANADYEDFGRGGGVAVSGEKANVTIDNCKIENNETSGNQNLSYDPKIKGWSGKVRFGSNGGGIYCEEGTVNLKGNTIISGNKIADNGNKRVGEGISINKPRGEDTCVELNIEGGVQIKDDIWLRTKESKIAGESNNVINVVGELTKVDENNPIKISSQDMLIEKGATEDNTILGAKLVRYAYGKPEEAGKAARKAAIKKYFVPSEHMPTELNLKIGQSQIEKNILTYVETLTENTPPVINASDKEIFVGDNFDPLKDVTVTDAEDETIPLTKDNIEENTVDISKPGEYKVTYSVTDKLGATTKKTIKVIVKSKSTGGGGGTIVTPPTETEPDRIEGDDRIETSIESSKDLYLHGANAVVLANAERYTDVLTANPFAVQEKAPTLLTYKNKLPEKTLKEIERLGAKKIYISGGYEAVSKKVVDELAARGYEIFRFDGVDRYDTARKIAIKIREKGNKNVAELASGENYPDALCMTPLAVKDHAPILLTKKDSIPKYTKQALAEWDIENIKIGGLGEAVSTDVEKQIKSGFTIDKNSKKDSNIYDGAKYVKRIGGDDRYETSAKLAAESYPDSKLGVYATGEDFPDALIAGNYAGRKEAPVLLVKGNDLPDPIEKYTKESKIEKATIFGGVNAVSNRVYNLIKVIINNNK